MKGTFLAQGHKYWILPILYIISAAALALLVDIVDRSGPLYEVLPEIFLTRAGLAKDVMSSIATSLLTMTTITFSVMMVVLSTYTSQYSPRTLPNFIRSKAMQHAQGVFFAGFVYSITSMLFLKRTSTDTMVPDASVGVLLAVCCLLFFIYFIHRISMLIQVNRLIAEIGAHALNLLQFLQPADAPRNAKASDKSQSRLAVVLAKNEGYIRSVDIQSVVNLAERNGWRIRMGPRIGAYVEQGAPLLEIFGTPHTGINSDNLDRMISIGKDRTNTHDLEYVLENIAEMALRAISPGINDPNTAIYCIRELGVILTRMASTDCSSWTFSDSTGTLRLEIPFLPYADLLYKCFYQIRHYGAKDISVSAALLDALTRIALNGDPRIKKTAQEFGDNVIQGINPGVLQSLDQSYLEQKKRQLSEACGIIPGS
ncbi:MULTISPECIES: DUF2254 domain-containing protein [Paenibacillus]|uniref:DUF2254 domain-containing protein n=1 Tax=Paenibacillus TaxID=44249 RepID=UPI0022B9180D|nr:DUF2254 domain-containing protein [Paenibacillus caseinilyticus]MCZ8521880.1 DUF2254 domain-containing protein [Paenibacillus caseinilyticus]